MNDINYLDNKEKIDRLYFSNQSGQKTWKKGGLDI